MVIMACVTILINSSKLPWNDHDREILAGLKRRDRCAQVWKDAPCLKKFIKRSFQNYWVICGKNNGKES